MSFWSDLGSTVLNTGAEYLGANLGSGIADQGFNALNNPSNSRRENRKNFHQDMQQQWSWDVKRANLGRDIDVGSQQEMFDFRLNRAKEAGLTNVEAFGSPAAGGAGGAGAAAATLGNGGTATGANLRQQATQQKIASEEKQKDRMTSLAQTAMQTNTQKDVAEIQAGTTQRGQDIDKAIKEGRLELDRDTYELNVKTASANIDKTEQQTAKLINEVATSDKKFITAMKQLSMGPANLLVELTMRHHGIALNDNSFMAMNKQQREAILAQILALSSSTYTEGMGATALGSNSADAATPLIDKIISIFQGGGIEPTNAPPNTPTLGKQFKPPKSYKERGRPGPQPFMTY